MALVLECSSLNSEFGGVSGPTYCNLKIGAALENCRLVVYKKNVIDSLNVKDKW